MKLFAQLLLVNLVFALTVSALDPMSFIGHPREGTTLIYLDTIHGKDNITGMLCLYNGASWYLLQVSGGIRTDTRTNLVAEGVQSVETGLDKIRFKTIPESECSKNNKCFLLRKKDHEGCYNTPTMSQSEALGMREFWTQNDIVRPSVQSIKRSEKMALSGGYPISPLKPV